MRIASLALSPLLAAALALAPSQVEAAANKWSLESPDRRIQIALSSEPQLTFAITFNGRTVISPSPLGLTFEGVAPKGGTLALKKEFRQSADASWQTTLGKNNPVRDRYGELTLQFTDAPTAAGTLGLVFRAYNDGIAFRYQLPAGDGGGQDFTITREDTQLNFASDPTLWAATYEKFTHAYEHEYPRTKLSSLYPSTLVGLPLLMQTDARTYVALAEADLTNWAGLYVKRGVSPSGTYALTAQLSPRVDGNGLVHSRSPRSSPWRVLMIGEKPGDLIESDLILNLNPPSAIADTSWIKPGKMAWDHWWSGDVKMDNPTEKRFIQFASDMGFPPQLVDWQWYGPYNTPSADITKPAPQLNFPELLQFASERNVRLWVWLHSGDVNRALKVGTLDEAFRVYERWNLAGVKIDFMDRDDQDMVEWYQRVVELAAKHHLMVDFHGAFKPTGLRRTWPNLLTREGVLGNEYNKFSGRITPEHKLTLPFTRMLVGPMDYTPGGFLNRSPAEWKQTTPTQVMGSRAQELALFVVYESALTCVTDDPENYRGQPGLEFLRAVPTTWDETRVLDGEVGRHIVIARRKGRDWFLGGMTGDDAYRVQIPLSFLGSGTFQAQVFADSGDPTANYEAVSVTQKRMTQSDKLTLTMRPAGGAAVYFKAQ